MAGSLLGALHWAPSSTGPPQALSAADHLPYRSASPLPLSLRFATSIWNTARRAQWCLSNGALYGHLDRLQSRHRYRRRLFAAATGLATSPSRSGCTEPEIASPAPWRDRLGGLQSPEKRGNHMLSAVPASEVTTESAMTEATRGAAHMVNTAPDQVAVIETPVAMMQMMMKTEVVASIEVAVIE